MFGMPNGSIIDLFAPEAASGMCPWGLNDGVVFGFRVDDIEQASQALEADGCELLGDVNFIEQLNFNSCHLHTAVCTASTSNTDGSAGLTGPGYRLAERSAVILIIPPASEQHLRPAPDASRMDPSTSTARARAPTALAVQSRRLRFRSHFSR